jgi:hypothetical protein
MKNDQEPDRVLELLDDTRDSLRAVEDLMGRALDPIAHNVKVELLDHWEVKMRETIAQFEGKFTLLLYEHNQRVRR